KATLDLLFARPGSDRWVIDPITTSIGSDHVILLVSSDLSPCHNSNQKSVLIKKTDFHTARQIIEDYIYDSPDVYDHKNYGDPNILAGILTNSIVYAIEVCTRITSVPSRSAKLPKLESALKKLERFPSFRGYIVIRALTASSLIARSRSSRLMELKTIGRFKKDSKPFYRFFNARRPSHTAHSLPPMKTTDADGKITLCTDDTLVANTFAAHFASNFNDVTPSPPHMLQPTTPFTPFSIPTIYLDDLNSGLRHCHSKSPGPDLVTNRALKLLTPLHHPI
ncbi:hypothetical protein Ciccas_014613, partial [Cichlidogyrus casuarinus]